MGYLPTKNLEDYSQVVSQEDEEDNLQPTTETSGVLPGNSQP